jgi:transglycosylase-like protein with SLT domain
MEFLAVQRDSRTQVKKTLYAFVCAFFCISASVSASLVIYNDGRVVKASAYRVSGDDLEIGLPGGGGYTTSLLLIERIVDDEVPPPVPESPAIEKPGPSRDLSYKPSAKFVFESRFDRLIDDECRKANLDAAFVSAVIKAESNFNPHARSSKGALGLMQLMPATAARLGVRRWFDPEANIRGGVRYLKTLCVRFSNAPELVLAAYNAGEEAVDAYQGVPPYRETVGYVKKILGWWSPDPLSPSV